MESRLDPPTAYNVTAYKVGDLVLVHFPNPATKFHANVRGPSTS